MGKNVRVSVITPTTHDREQFNQRCADLIRSQDYLNIEHLFDYESGTIGQKLNRLCERATGDIIIRADSDDVYMTEWVSTSILALGDYECTGLSTAYFHNVHTGNVYLFEPQPRRQVFLCGATLCFSRSAWDRVRFPNTSQGEERDFQSRLKCVVNPNSHLFLATLHGRNTCSDKAVWAMKKLPHKEAASVVNRIYYASAGSTTGIGSM